MLIITVYFLLCISCTKSPSYDYLEQLSASERQLSEDILVVKDIYDQTSYAKITSITSMAYVEKIGDDFDLKNIRGSIPFIKDLVLASKNSLLITNAIIDYMARSQDAAVCYNDIIFRTINFMDRYKERVNIKEENRLIYNQKLINEISDFIEGLDSYYFPIIEKFEKSRLSINHLIRAYNVPFPHDF